MRRVGVFPGGVVMGSTADEFILRAAREASHWLWTPTEGADDSGEAAGAFPGAVRPSLVPPGAKRAYGLL
jgi:hypothetical protein